MGVTFEQFAAVRAAIERGESREQVLARHRLTTLQWRAAQRRWLWELVREAKRGGNRYGGRFRDALLGPREVSPDVAGGVEVAATALPSAVAPVGVLPTAPRAEPVSAPVPPMPPPLVAANPVPAPSRGRSPSLTSSMTAMPEMGVHDTSLPFHGDPAEPPRPVADEVAREAELLVGETGFVAALSDEEVANATPFEGPRATPAPLVAPSPAAVSPSTTPPPAAPPSSAPPSAAPPSAAPHDPLGETAFITNLDIGDDPLPFTGRAGAHPSVEHELHALAGHTGSVAALRDDELQPLPFAVPAKPRVGAELSLEQYASLRAELDRTSGSERLLVLTRYGIASEEVFTEVERRWADTLRVTPADYGRFRAAYDTFSQWLAGLK